MPERDQSFISSSVPDNRLARETSGELNEKCAVLGITNAPQAATLMAEGLLTLQHRGQESTGISVTDGNEVRTHKKRGLVLQVYTEKKLQELTEEGFNMGVGHNRYATYTQANAEKCHVQPILKKSNDPVLVHNGNLPDTTNLEEFLDEEGISRKHLTDSGMMHAAITHYTRRGAPLEDAVSEALPLFTGSYSLLVMDKGKLIAVRDQRGIRPLSIGQLNRGFVFASETCAFDIMSAEHGPEVRPGEMVVATRDGEISSVQLDPNTEQKLDIFEFVYFARPDSYLLGQQVNEVRKRFGAALWEESGVHGDLVMQVPDSGTAAATGYAAASGTPFFEGFAKNRYSSRVFMQPDANSRARATRMKLNPLRETIRGKDLVVIDDSIVRGTTTQTIVRVLKEAGARKVHMMITCPPIRFPDFYGIDTPRQSDLIAARLSIEEIREFIGADSLHFLSLDGMLKATGIPADQFSTSSFTGEYPIPIGKRAAEVAYQFK
jgi:amidophosphoribosyltransferase